MPNGLPRKLRYAFIVQALIASVAIVAGVYAAGHVVKPLLFEQRLRIEAENYWAGHAHDPAFPLPHTYAVMGWFVATGQSATAVPASLRGYAPGVHGLPGDTRKLLVDERPQGRLYLVMQSNLIDAVIHWMVIASLLLSLLVVHATSWMTYRRTRRLVAPVGWLAEQVAHLDPGDPDISAIAPERLPEGSGGEVRQLSAALRDLSARTHMVVQRERDFTRDASHELRTPLTVVRVATDMLIADPDTSLRAQRALGRVQRAGRDMEALIDAFLILARESGNAPLAEDFDVLEIVNDELDKVRPSLVDKQVALELLANAAPRLHASPRVLAVMLGQLLENACAFTECGRIEVHVEADSITVADTGIGMSVELLQRAHDPFYRGDQFSQSGKGMGLSIVRRLGERFGWPVTLDSVPGEGTTARVGFAGDLID